MSQVRGDYLEGSFRRPERPDGEIVRESPAERGLVLGAYPTSLAAVDGAVAAARRAQPAWARLSIGERGAALRRVKDAFASRTEDLARRIAIEIGKAIW